MASTSAVWTQWMISLALIVGLYCASPGAVAQQSELNGTSTSTQRSFGAPLSSSSNVVELDQFTFYPSIADGRVWFVEFYVPWCRSCKRLANQWSQLADALAADHDDTIAVARFNCDVAEELCDALEVSRTPTLKVYFQGADVETYKADYLHIDLFRPFILRMRDRLLGLQPASAAA